MPAWRDLTVLQVHSAALASSRTHSAVFAEHRAATSAHGTRLDQQTFRFGEVMIAVGAFREPRQRRYPSRTVPPGPRARIAGPVKVGP